MEEEKCGKYKLLGSIRRADTTYYAGYSSGMLVEFTLRADTMPTVVGRIRKAVEKRALVKIDVDDVERHRAIDWTKTQEFQEATWTGKTIIVELRHAFSTIKIVSGTKIAPKKELIILVHLLLSTGAHLHRQRKTMKSRTQDSFARSVSRQPPWNHYP